LDSIPEKSKLDGKLKYGIFLNALNELKILGLIDQTSKINVIFISNLYSRPIF
jgi:hypothetical protein